MLYSVLLVSFLAVGQTKSNYRDAQVTLAAFKEKSSAGDAKESEDGNTNQDAQGGVAPAQGPGETAPSGEPSSSWTVKVVLKGVNYNTLTVGESSAKLTNAASSNTVVINCQAMEKYAIPFRHPNRIILEDAETKTRGILRSDSTTMRQISLDIVNPERLEDIFSDRITFLRGEIIDSLTKCSEGNDFEQDKKSMCALMTHRICAQQTAFYDLCPEKCSGLGIERESKGVTTTNK